jgi:hypothetical protein
MRAPRSVNSLLLGLAVALLSCKESTSPAPVASVTVTPATATLQVGQTQQLTAITLSPGGTALTGRAVTWSSSDVSIATVSTIGLVTAVAAGNATISATSEGRTGTAISSAFYPTQQTCKATRPYDAASPDFVIGEYRVRNDMWGVQLGWVQPPSAFTQCMTATQLSANSFTASWNWSFASNAVVNILSGYPGFIYGWNPGEPKSTTAAMPVAVGNIGALAVTYDVAITTTGHAQTFFDLYFASTAVPSLATMTHEVSISIGATTIDGQAFEVYLGHTSLPQADQIVWIAKPDILKGTLNVKKFTDYMLSKGLIKPSEFLTSIEFGTEPGGGTGAVTVKYYSVTR